MLSHRDVFECAWHTILLHGAGCAEQAAEAKIAELRREGCHNAAEMWESIKACIPELLANPDLWDELPSDVQLTNP